MNFDVIVIGAGPSGIMAAISAAEMGARTLILEKNKKLARKLLLTGGGRCNVTNNKTIEDIIEHIPGNGKFLYSTFSQYDNYDIMEFFAAEQVKLKEEDHGRMFPVSDQSKTIVEALVNKMKQLGVVIYSQTRVKKLLTENNTVIGVKTETKERLLAQQIILATGGMSYPQTGSSGDGYRLAKQVGHTITPLFPTESPLVSKEPFILQKQLQGLALQNVAVSVLNAKGKTLVTHQLDLLFTHFGLSGPAALRCSYFVYQELQKQEQVILKIDVFPEVSSKKIQQIIEEKQQLAPEKSIKNTLRTLLPERLLSFLLKQVGINENKSSKELLPTEVKAFSWKLKNFNVIISSVWPLEKAFVTGGGVHLKEIEPKTLASKKAEGLFFCGELLDINGYTGGYNVTAALATGYVAGYHAALKKS